MKTILTAADLGLYLGCLCQVENEDHEIFECYLMGIDNVAEEALVDWQDDNVWTSIEGVKPVLRRLESIAIDEALKLVSLSSDIYLNLSILEIDRRWIWFEFEYKSSSRRRKQMLRFDKLTAAQFQYILSKHFDLFGWIELGLAIDQATLNPTS